MELGALIVETSKGLLDMAKPQQELLDLGVLSLSAARHSPAEAKGNECIAMGGSPTWYFISRYDLMDESEQPLERVEYHVIHSIDG